MKHLLVLILVAFCAAPVAVFAADNAGKTLSDAERAKLEKQLAEARESLNQTARQIAELTIQLNNGDGDPMAWHIMQRDHGRLGLMVFGTRESGSVDGVKVVGVTPGGPGAKAGLKSGDLIVAIGDTRLAAESSGEALERFMHQLRGVKPGDTVKLEYRRDGKSQHAELVAATGGPGPHITREYRVLSAGPGMPEGAPMPGMPPMPTLLGPWQGIQLVKLTPPLGKYFKTDQGILVVRAPGSAGLPLEDGDVIVKIGERAPQDPAQAMRILSSYNSGDSVALSVVRQGKRRTLAIKVPEAPVGPQWRVHKPMEAPPAPPQP